MSATLENDTDAPDDFEAALVRVQEKLKQNRTNQKPKSSKHASTPETRQYYDASRSPPPPDSGAFSIDWRHKPSFVEEDRALSEYQRYQELCEALPESMLHPREDIDTYSSAECLRIKTTLERFQGQAEKDYWDSIATARWDPNVCPFPEDIHYGYQDLAIMLANAPDSKDGYAFDAWEEEYIRARDEHRIRVSKMHESVEEEAAARCLSDSMSSSDTSSAVISL